MFVNYIYEKRNSYSQDTHQIVKSMDGLYVIFRIGNKAPAQFPVLCKQCRIYLYVFVYIKQ